MKIRPTVLHFVCAILLLLSQQLATAHAISHLGAPTQSTAPDGQLPDAQSCDQCLVFSAFGAALGSSFQTAFAAPLARADVFPEAVEQLLPASLRPFNSRAPPFLS